MASEADFYIKEGDTSPSLRAQLREDDETPVDCTGAIVQFQMNLAGSETHTVDSRATIDTPEDGIVTYDWHTGDTTDAGYYNATFGVDYDGAVEVTDEQHTYTAGTDTYVLDNTDVLVDGYYTVTISDDSGDTYDRGTDFAVIDDDSDSALDTIDWSIGDTTPDDTEDFFVTYHYATSLDVDETFPNTQYIVVKIDDPL